MRDRQRRGSRRLSLNEEDAISDVTSSPSIFPTVFLCFIGGRIEISVFSCLLIS